MVYVALQVLLCHALGRETITIFNPDVIVDQKTEDGIATMHDPNKLQEVKRFESPDNF
ncbi:hypothetical protein KTJ63_19150 [Acinetobacter baumannii]|nr:hypothetical protein [Acinetobacter baumannii]